MTEDGGGQADISSVLCCTRRVAPPTFLHSPSHLPPTDPFQPILIYSASSLFNFPQSLFLSFHIVGDQEPGPNGLANHAFFFLQYSFLFSPTSNACVSQRLQSPSDNSSLVPLQLDNHLRSVILTDTQLIPRNLSSSRFQCMTKFFETQFGIEFKPT